MSNKQIPATDSDLPIAIIGGGLGGLALAIGLAKHGLAIHIYEAAAAFSEIGAGVAFGVNSTRALELIDPLLLQGYKKHATFNQDPELDEVMLCLCWGMDERKVGGRKAGERCGNIRDKRNPEKAKAMGVRTRSCIHRARLLDVLISMIPQGITSFGKEFDRVEEETDGTLRLHFVDGSAARARAMIGCDGVKSRSRTAVCGPGTEASFVGEYAYRALVPKAEAEGALGVHLAQNGYLFCGYDSYLISYPVEHGAFTNMVAISQQPTEIGTAANRVDWTIPTTTAEFLHDFKGWNIPHIEVFQRHCHAYKWALFHVQHSNSYYKGRMCLLGDSAHATTPHMGGGAGMAMEDAYILSSLIGSLKSLNEVEDAFRAYDAVRRPRTQKLVQFSRDAGLLVRLAMPGVEDDTQAVLETLDEWYGWLWHEDLEAQLETARQLLVKYSDEES